MADGDDSRLFLELGSVVVVIDFAGRQDACSPQHGARSLAELLPGHDIGVVLHFRDEDSVTLANREWTVGRSHQIDRLRGATRPEQLVGRTGIDSAGKRLPGGLECRRGLVGESVGTPVHVGVCAPVVAGQRIEHRRWFLGGRGVVEVDQVGPVRQQRKIRPPGRLGHWITPSVCAVSRSSMASRRKPRTNSVRAVCSSMPRVRK